MEHVLHVLQCVCHFSACVLTFGARPPEQTHSTRACVACTTVSGSLGVANTHMGRFLLKYVPSMLFTPQETACFKTPDGALGVHDEPLGRERSALYHSGRLLNPYLDMSFRI